MSSADLTIDQWQIRFHETMAAILRAKEAVKRQFGLLGLLNGLWTSSRDLKLVNETLKAMSELPDGILSEEFIRSHVPQVRKLLRSIEELIDIGKSRGLTNRSFTAGVFEAIRSRGEYVAAYLDALELSIDPEVLKAIDDGRDQIARGDFEEMESLI